MAQTFRWTGVRLSQAENMAGIPLNLGPTTPEITMPIEISDEDWVTYSAPVQEALAEQGWVHAPAAQSVSAASAVASAGGSAAKPKR